MYELCTAAAHLPSSLMTLSTTTRPLLLVYSRHLTKSSHVAPTGFSFLTPAQATGVVAVEVEEELEDSPSIP